MKLLLNGYYGYDNAGDEAVLAAVLQDLSARLPAAQFLVTSGNPRATEFMHGGPPRNSYAFDGEFEVRALPRQNPRALLAALRECDGFISGGGSLLQDATSLRNVAYYAGLMRLARLCRKPLMVYAQGVGPLRSRVAQKLARAGVEGAQVVTVRDEASKALLRRIGVRRNIEVTADPVWGLARQQGEKVESHGARWAVALRAPTEGAADFGAAIEEIRRLARAAGASLLWLPMQQSRDLPLVQPFIAQGDAVLQTAGVHPSAILERLGGCELMIAMRLHALIFAGARGVPCVALNYDPKVEALARIMDAPLLPDLSPAELPKLPAAIENARPLSDSRRAELANLAARNAELAAAILS